MTSAALPLTSTAEEGWLDVALESLRDVGCCVVTGVAAPALLADLRTGLEVGLRAVREEVGIDRLQRAGEKGVVRAPMRFHDSFYELLGLQPILDVIDRTVSETAILHLQNGFVLPPSGDGPSESFQESFHPDFPRHLNGYVASINALLAVDEFTAENGATIAVPGSHQRTDRPSESYMSRQAVPVECPSGSVLFFDSTLMHAAGRNNSAKDRLAVNMQFTRSFFKQQIDYVRCLGHDAVLAQPDRTQQLLGWYTRTVSSLDEYYQPADRRLYRSGQG